MANSWNQFFYIRKYQISWNIITVHISENVQNKVYHLETRREQFTDQTQKAKKILISWKWTFINENTKSPRT